MSEQVVNIGQIAAIWIASTPPENIKLIWYNTASQVHCVYDSYTGDWKPLNPQIITTTSINTLRSEVEQSGSLPIGKFYNLEDTRTLAISITATKIWYVDTHGNYVVDDLASSAQYYLNSTNLYIDGETGVWDVNSGHLSFSFSEENTASNLDTDKDYVVMRHNAGNGVWSWIKSKISTFIPSGGGNSISWNNGIYFNFSSAIDAIKNVAGGIVGKDEYESDKAALQQSIQNTALNNQSYAAAANSYTDSKVTDEEIYDKELPTSLTVPSAPPTTPSVGAKLITIIEQIYGWISKLKHGNSVMLDQGLNPNGVDGKINVSDSVVSAFNKVIGWIKKLQLANNINVGTGFDPEGVQGDFSVSDSVMSSIEKLIWKTKHVIRIDEDNWHTEGSFKWIIRNDVMYVKFNNIIEQTGVHAYLDRCTFISNRMFGENISPYVNQILNKIDWLYQNTIDGTRIKQKWVYVCDAICVNADIVSYNSAGNFSGKVVNNPLGLYLCIQESENLDSHVISQSCGFAVRYNNYYGSVLCDTNDHQTVEPILKIAYYYFIDNSSSTFSVNVGREDVVSIPLSC